MNATKFEKVLVTGICLLAIVLVVLLTVHMLWAQEADAATVTGQLSTGECGYYQNQGTLHRNGLVTPDHCSQPADNWNMSPAPVVTVDSVPQSVPGTSYVPNTPIVDDGDKPAEEPIVTDKPAVTDDKPVKVDDGSKPDKKQKCNNGNGNGAEGCNASDKGNQDETGDKGDKADSRDNGNSDNDHGKGKGQDKK